MNGESGKKGRLYSGYLKDIQRYYEREPIVQASLQLILSLFTVAFFVFLAIRPTLATITTLLKTIDDQRLADERLGRKITQLAQVQEFLLAQGEEIDGLSETAVPENPMVKRLAQEIELIANNAGVFISILNIQPSPLVGNKASLTESTRGQTAPATVREQFVTFNFTVVGQQNNLINFLDSMEKLDRAITLTNVIFSKPQTSGEISFPLAVAGKATAYYLAPRPTPAAVVTP